MGRSDRQPATVAVLMSLGVPLWILGACAAVKPPAPAGSTAGKPAAPPPGMSVEKMREQLQVAPWEIALSGVRGEGETTEVVTARNLVDHPVTVSSVSVAGDAASLFAVKAAPMFPATIPAKGTLSVEIAFRPPADAEAGLKRAVLRFQTGSASDDGPAADLSALVISARDPSAEPSLQQIVETLGFAVDVGGRDLVLPDTGAPAGDQVVGAFFERARPGPVAINPVARFSEDGPLPFGFYLPGTSLKEVDARPLGVLMAGENQTLNPGVDEGVTSFDPGDSRFGIWLGAGEHAAFTENRRNRGPDRRLARIYPLRARGGAAIPDAYLVAFGTASRSDYQDGVFVLWNVKLAARGN